MGEIIRFPKRRRNHDRASAFSRSANPTSTSALKPAPLATAEFKSAAHHSSGIRSLCDHLRAAATDAPMSDAMASGDGHSPMIERNEVGASGIMDAHLGQFVLNCKAKVSYDFQKPLGDNAGMAETMSETEENLAFVARVRTARKAKFRTQKPVYSYLGMDQDHYKHFEIDRPLPRRYIPKFCLITEVSMEWLLTAEGNGPVPSESPKPEPRPPRPPRQQRRKRVA